jgi:hypothetical protein
MKSKASILFTYLKAQAIVATLVFSGVSLRAQTCYPNLVGTLSNDDTVNTGSPFTFIYQGNFATIYPQTNNQPNPVMLDQSPNGYLGSPVSTGLPTNSQTALGDATGASLGSTMFIAYVPYNSTQIKIAVSSTPPSPWTSYNFSVGVADYRYTPTLIAYGGLIYAAYVSGGQVYLASSSNGQVFTPVSSAPVTTYSTRSRPAMAVLGNDLYVGFTTSNGNLVIGRAYVNGAYAPNLVPQSSQFGNNNSKGLYAGVALLGDTITNEIWVFGQNASSYQLQEVSGTGTSFSAPYPCGGTIRWTPSIAQYSGGSGYVMFTFQNTQNQRLWYVNN